MATMLTNVNLSACQRPVYSSYELSELVKNKRKESCKNEKDFADIFNVEVEILKQIEDGKRSFTPKLYRACSKILGISLEDIIAMENDEKPSFRVSEDNEEIRNIFEMANFVFDEIIMQKKISARTYRQVTDI